MTKSMSNAADAAAAGAPIKQPCTLCGKPSSPGDYMNCPERREMEKSGVCFICACWSLRRGEANTVIEGHMYTPGTRTSGPMRGMAGRRFDIEYFDGRTITTFDLWSGGEIPPHFRKDFPDNARFLNGAKRSVVGGIGCWDASVKPKSAAEVAQRAGSEAAVSPEDKP